MTQVSIPAVTWAWPARVERVIDADTIEVVIDRGFRDSSRRMLRLAGVNAAERGTAAGIAAREYALKWLTEANRGDWPLVVCGLKPDKYGGRWDGTVWRVSDGHSLAADLIKAGHAKPWDGNGVRP